MSDVPDKSSFAKAYADKAPWDIGGPQPALVEAADAVTGSILDAGCGTGENALFFAARGHKVTGVDFLDEPIRRARDKAAQRGVRANFLVLDALALDQLPELFDSAIDCGLFHVFADDARGRYVAGLSTVVKPGGKLFLLCFSDAEPGTAGPRRVSQDELRAAFADGWHVESIQPTQFQAIPEFAHLFSPGGPHAWFMVARRA